MGELLFERHHYIPNQGKGMKCHCWRIPLQPFWGDAQSDVTMNIMNSSRPIEETYLVKTGNLNWSEHLLHLSKHQLSLLLVPELYFWRFFFGRHPCSQVGQPLPLGSPSLAKVPSARSIHHPETKLCSLQGLWILLSCKAIFSSWWFQPIWKIWVKLDHFPR